MSPTVRAEAVPVTFHLREGYRIAGHHFTRAENVLLRIDTDDGLTGFGCAAPFEEVTGESPAASLATLRDILIPLLGTLGCEAPDPLLARAAALAPGAPAARAALDMAVLDLAARRAGVPLHRYLGTVRERVPTSVTLGIEDDVESAVSRGRRWLEQGYRILKIKVGEDWEADARLVRRLREALGPEVILRADANQGYTEEEAGRFLAVAGPLGLELLEQPTPAADPEALRRLRRPGGVPIMADESLVTPEDAERLLRGSCVDLLNVKLMKAGGVRAGLGIARRSAAVGVGIMVGCNDESRISIAAALHLALASPCATRADLDGHLDLQDDVALGGFVVRDGFLEPLPAPGLGVDASF